MSTMETQTQLEILRARRRVLHQTTPQVQTSWLHHTEETSEDPFACESYGFFLPFPDVVEAGGAANSSQPKAKDVSVTSRADTNSASKVTKPRRRFVSNWTPEMDLVIRKALTKYGWGAWTRIAQSGKLPKEYTPKMISNRANSIGLTKDMFARKDQLQGPKDKN